MYLIIHDETTAGSILNQVKLKLSRDVISIAELIRIRVFQEVNEYNQKRPEYYRGLVQPAHAEIALNGYKMDKKHRIDPETQFSIAIDAFRRNEFQIIVDEKPVNDPDYSISVCPHTKISFLKLTTLVGG
ncbi:MAG: hypothetical protein SF052_21475 [Bacteroidia bacterium]|nr:hypothetical protein [Bacteroidia bacterium]